MKAYIHVTLKPGVLDPQGKAIRHALVSLGFAGIEEARLGKYIEIDLGDADAKTARAQVIAMCDKLLANPVIENYRIELSAS